MQHPLSWESCWNPNALVGNLSIKDGRGIDLLTVQIAMLARDCQVNSCSGSRNCSLPPDMTIAQVSVVEKLLCILQQWPQQACEE